MVIYNRFKYILNYIALAGNTASKIPITTAASIAPIIVTPILGTKNCAKYIIIAAIINPFIPYPKGDASTPISNSTK